MTTLLRFCGFKDSPQHEASKARLKQHEQIAGTERLYHTTVPAELRAGALDVKRDCAAFAISEARSRVLTA